MNNNSHTASNSTDLLKTPGQLLREKRLKLGIDAKQASDSLKITCTRLAAIEADDYGAFVSSLYIRGHLRNYAQLVDISQTEIMDCYYAYIDSLPQTALDETQENITSVSNVAHYTTRWRRPYFVIAGLILLWVVTYSFIGNDSHQQILAENEIFAEDPVKQVALAKTANSVTANNIVNNSTSVEVDSNKTSGNVANSEITHSAILESGFAEDLAVAQSIPANDSTSAGAIKPSIGAATVEAPSVIESPSTVSADEIDQLVLSFTDDCWLEVTDARGRILAAKLHRAGDQLILRGTAPFNIMLGNAEAAELRLNGKAVAVTPIGSRRTLRFTVGNT